MGSHSPIVQSLLLVCALQQVGLDRWVDTGCSQCCPDLSGRGVQICDKMGTMRRAEVVAQEEQRGPVV